MKIEHHIALSVIISGFLYMIFKSLGLSIASFVTGIFIDIDHIIDYFIEHGININFKNFLPFFYNEEHQKITLLLHGWEWLFCLAVIATQTEFNPWITGAFIGYGHHITFDYLCNKTGIRTYSLIWRWKNNFDSHTIFPRDRGYKPKHRRSSHN